MLQLWKQLWLYSGDSYCSILLSCKPANCSDHPNIAKYSLLWASLKTGTLNKYQRRFKTYNLIAISNKNICKTYFVILCYFVIWGLAFLYWVTPPPLDVLSATHAFLAIYLGGGGRERERESERKRGVGGLPHHKLQVAVRRHCKRVTVYSIKSSMYLTVKLQYTKLYTLKTHGQCIPPGNFEMLSRPTVWTCADSF